MKKLSIVIPIYNALGDLKLLLESLDLNLDFEICEVFLINDCSGEETSDFLNDLAAKDRRYKYIINEENLGFVQTCNKGMELSSGEIVILLNSDTKIPKSFCEKVIKCFESDEKIGVASPISSSSHLYYIPLPENMTIEQMNDAIEECHKCSYPVIPAAEGFCFCIRKSVIEQQGCLDTVWGKGYNEEVDFAYRAITNGWKNVLIDNLYVYHKSLASFGKQNKYKLIERNHAEFQKRWGGFSSKYILENNLLNPIEQIEAEVFPGVVSGRKRIARNFIEYIFSIKNTLDKRHKVITILGLSIKWKRKAVA